MLTVRNVTKKYGSFTVLENVSLELENGVYGLIAPNGAGKTTLIKMLATLSFPTSGEILYDGKDIIKMDKEYREKIGYLPQEFGYYPSYTPRQYLRYLCALKGIGKKEGEERIKELLELVSLSGEADKKMKKFSGGMLQRVGIAQALLNDPKILMLDEPTAGLDPKERVRFRNIISNLSKDRMVLLSTHIVSDVETIANEIIMLKDHHIFTHDTAEHICALLEGKVYELKIPQDNLPALEKEYLLLSMRQEGCFIHARFAAETLPPDGSVSAQPNLEDVFLYVYQDEIKGEENDHPL